MIKRALALAAVAAGLCFGSAGAMADAPKLDISKLVQATHTDLQAAKADADAHGDKLASQCYGGVDAFITANPVQLPALNVVGVASAFQTARDAVKVAETASGPTGGIPVDLELACGPLALDVQNDLGKIATSGVSIFGLKLF